MLGCIWVISEFGHYKHDGFIMKAVISQNIQFPQKVTEGFVSGPNLQHASLIEDDNSIKGIMQF